MITLITGTPGSGKTLYTVAELLGREYSGRRLLVSGIPDLAVDHLPLSDDQAASWHSNAEPNDVIVIDEVQRIWRPRSTGAAVPDGVAQLETHRHKGVDLVLITQHPNLLDQNARRLVGRHLHVRRVWGMSRALVYEWDQATDPNRIKTAMTKHWSYPKSAYNMYKSATIHTARGQRPPFVLWFTLAMLLAAPFGGWLFYDRFQSKYTSPIETQPARASASAPTAPAALPAAAPITLGPEAWVQRLPDMPATAPLYDGVRRVVEVPRITGCMASRGTCSCFTQQATIAEVSPGFCARWLAGERPYDPFSENRSSAPHSSPAQAAPPSREGGGVSLPS